MAVIRDIPPNLLRPTIQQLAVVAPEETFTKAYCGAAIRSIELIVDRLWEKFTRLYEQGADNVRIGKYVQHWSAAVKGGGPIFRAIAVWVLIIGLHVTRSRL